MHRLEAPELPDAQLVRLAREGNRWAQEMLFRRHAPSVFGTATRLLGDRSRAEDVVQDAFVIALESLGDLRNPAAFRGWILRIAVSQVHRIFRKERVVRLFRGSDSPPAFTALACATASPETLVELELLGRALRRLPAKDRLAWMLRHVEGFELREVATACNCSLATAKRRIAAADARVRRHVGEVAQ